jgi:ABC-type uncharacterized transport system substrate-binding protein
MIRRRDFITLLSGAAAWPLAAHAQQTQRMRRIGVLAAGDENDPLAKVRYSAFTQALAGLGWTDGRNLRMDLRWGGGDADRIRVLAHELVRLQPDIILTGTTVTTIAVQRETRTIPIVFVNVGDPVASGIYGPDNVDTYRRSASYVDRILRGAKPSDLPVQLPTKFQMVVNRKTATALGLAIPGEQTAVCRVVWDREDGRTTVESYWILDVNQELESSNPKGFFQPVDSSAKPTR